MKRPDWLPTLAATMGMLLLAGGCSDTSTGTPNTATSVAPSTTSHGDPGPSMPSGSDNPFEGMVACDVLDTALDKLEDWDFPDGEYDKSGGPNGCGSTIPQKVSVGLTLQPGGTLDDFVDDPTKAYDGDIKGRPAVEERDGYEKGSCMLAMAVGPNDRAFLSVASADMSRDEGCNLVEDIARKVEPLLPGNYD